MMGRIVDIEGLKPCPICGSKPLLVEHEVDHGEGKIRKHYEIICDHCFLRTDCINVQALVDRWNHREAAEWISVKDRLPEEGAVVVVFVKNKLGVGYAEVDVYLMGDFDEYSEGVTHWMPLPEPPKGE